MTKNKKYEYFAKHECGHIERIPHGNISFLTKFGYICPKCGKPWKVCDIDEQFIGHEKFDGKWYNPLSWFNWKIVRTGK